MPAQGAVLVLYDGDCRICTAFARALRALDIHRAIRIRPIQDSRDMLSGIPDDKILDAAHAVTADGRLVTGANAMPTILGALLGVPGVEPLLRSSRSSMAVLSRFYALLVEFRGHLTCAFASGSSEGRTPR